MGRRGSTVRCGATDRPAHTDPLSSGVLPRTGRVRDGSAVVRERAWRSAAHSGRGGAAWKAARRSRVAGSIHRTPVALTLDLTPRTHLHF
eukprot:scaffold139139_cov133-Phaeocystis_antarctica.AAC.1